jgi:hypothetical protein
MKTDEVTNLIKNEEMLLNMILSDKDVEPI